MYVFFIFLFIIDLTRLGPAWSPEEHLSNQASTKSNQVPVIMCETPPNIQTEILGPVSIVMYVSWLTIFFIKKRKLRENK